MIFYECPIRHSYAGRILKGTPQPNPRIRAGLHTEWDPFNNPRQYALARGPTVPLGAGVEVRLLGARSWQLCQQPQACSPVGGL